MQKKSERLDVFLVKKGFFESRSRAQAAIMEGKVIVDSVKVTKPGTLISDSAEVEITGDQLKYVSRGGLKLEKAVNVFGISFEGKVVLDIGASTGGFTDCALQNGARKVYAVDVGYGQLAWKLRNDPRVVNLERKNARTLAFEDIGEKVDIVTVDVSFISLKKIIPPVACLLKENGEVVALIKPQFEAGKDKVGKKGVVRNPETHREVLKDIAGALRSFGFAVQGLTFSPIKGPQGNIEYLVYAVYGKDGDSFPLGEVESVVDEAWETL